ncbi:hypothetical protein PG993_003175 [Apiospora rasikravindrae]|uniref:Uncharacterized protein n=1 Tax=Apiospora rasikravindrae TaxID=990691 RepID=A0ABR1TYT3_9PEZI
MANIRDIIKQAVDRADPTNILFNILGMQLSSSVLIVVYVLVIKQPPVSWIVILSAMILANMSYLAFGQYVFMVKSRAQGMENDRGMELGNRRPGPA